MIDWKRTLIAFGLGLTSSALYAFGPVLVISLWYWTGSSRVAVTTLILWLIGMIVLEVVMWRMWRRWQK